VGVLPGGNNGGDPGEMKGFQEGADAVVELGCQRKVMTKGDAGTR